MGERRGGEFVGCGVEWSAGLLTLGLFVSLGDWLYIFLGEVKA